MPKKKRVMFRIKPTLPPRDCFVSEHAIERYRMRVENVANAAQVLKHRLNTAKLCRKYRRLEKGKRAVWLSEGVLLVTEYNGTRLILVTCFRQGDVDNRPSQPVN